MSTPTAFMKRDRVTVTPYLSRANSDGEKTYNTSAATTHRAQVVRKRRFLGSPGGQERLSTVQAIVLSPDREIQLQDRIAVAGFGELEVLAIEGVPDARGVVREYEVFFGPNRRVR